MRGKGSLPPPQNLFEFVERVRVIAHLYGFSCNSWGRTDPHNFSVKGNKNSWHRWERGGMGADLQPPVGAPRSYTEKVAKVFRRLGMDAVTYKRRRHLHVEPSD